MKQIVFYSWQSDLPNSTNRGFIQKILEKAAKLIREDDSVAIEPVIMRDTAGEPGSPDIGATIFKRIENAHTFVCDVSFINKDSSNRLTPNPNVLLELGFALNALGHERIVMVMNTAFGEPEALPFDLKMRRVITYCLKENEADKAKISQSLEGSIERAIKTILSGSGRDSQEGKLVQPTPIQDQLKEAIAKNAANQDVLARKFMSRFSDEISRVAPDFKGDKAPEDAVKEAIDNSTGLMTEFATVAELVSEMNSMEVSLAIYKSFGLLLMKYDTPIGFTGTSYSYEFDFFKFVGHEAFVVLIGMLIRNERWQLIAAILNQTIYLEKALYGGQASERFSYAN